MENELSDKELFKLWDEKIKIELTKDVISNKKNPWALSHAFGHRVVGRFIRKVKIGRGKPILEIGCGQCDFPDYLEPEKLRNYIGLDISKKMLDLSPAQLKKVQADIYYLPFQNGAVDVIISIYNLEHMHYLEEALAEIARVLKKNGILIFAIPMENGFLYNLGRNLISRKIVEKRYGIDYMKIIREYEHPNSAAKILSLVDKKFNILKKTYQPFLIPSINLNLFAVYQVAKK